MQRSLGGIRCDENGLGYLIKFSIHRVYEAKQSSGTLGGGCGTASPSRRSTTLQVVDGQRFLQ